jgi:RNA polymerase sigma factor (TIGR02999 family)
VQATSGDVTGLLQVWSEGDQRAFDRLIPLVYGELHRMAHRYLSRERRDVSMQATGLVNEVCLRLLGWDPVQWQNRGHFFGVSAQMMRRVLVDIARRRRAGRRGGPGVGGQGRADCDRSSLAKSPQHGLSLPRG